MSAVLRVGLTGGIASGKSTVAAMFADRGLPVIDADEVARDVVEPGTPGLAAVVAEFGDAVRAVDGGLNRAALGRIVFADPDSRARLEEILHPVIRQRSGDLEAALVADGHRVVVHEIPLLVETGQVDRFDVVVVVSAPEELRRRRLQEQRGLTAVDAAARIASQASEAERRAAADLLIDNDADVAQLRARTDTVIDRIRALGDGSADPAARVR